MQVFWLVLLLAGIYFLRFSDGTIHILSFLYLETQSAMGTALFVSVGISSFGMFLQHTSDEVKRFEPFLDKSELCGSSISIIVNEEHVA
jgi:hypothetical protein